MEKVAKMYVLDTTDTILISVR